MLTRAELEAREAAALAPYAMRSRDSRGRRHPEPEHPLRMAFQRDRDRIIHSTAFRRLEYKTQVFVNHEGDYYRTRLTHTIEAAQITRTVAQALGLNRDLAEAVALAHDADDGVKAGMLTVADLETTELFREARASIAALDHDPRLARYQIVNRMI